MSSTSKSNSQELMGRRSIPVREARDAEQPTVTLKILVPGLESAIRSWYNSTGAPLMLAVLVVEFRNVALLWPLFWSVNAVILVQAGIDDAIERVFCSQPRSIPYRIQSNVESPFELHFNCKLKQTLYTGDRIKVEGDEPIQIVIRDASTKETITSGPLSSIRIKITVLDGDFNGNEQGYWTMQEFCDGEVHPRDGKGTLLKGLIKMKLKDGVGYFKDLTFTDNSHCIKSGKFRLGASVVQSSYAGERIREARSEAFAVKDRRVKLSKKPESPSPTDEVWRLKNIRKNGVFHKRLEKVKIKTVQEFRRHLATDHDRLLKVLGSRMSRNKWKQTVEHAQKCVSDNTLYSQNLVEDSMQLVCELPESIVEYNGSLHDGPSFPQLQASLVPGSQLGQQNLDSLITHQYKPEAELNFESPVGQNEFTAGSSQPYNSAVVQNVHLIQGNSSHSFMEATEAIENSGPLFDNPLMPTSGLQAFPTVDLDHENHNLLIAHQIELAALWNFMQPANGNKFVVGPSQLSDPILGQNSSNAMGHFHEQNIGYGYKFGTGGFVGSFAVGQQSLTDDGLQMDGFVDSFLASSPAAIGGPKRKRWLKVGAVLKWTVRKPIAAKA